VLGGSLNVLRKAGFANEVQETMLRLG